MVGARSFTSAAAAMASSSIGSAKVLVKIGSGEDSLFPVPHDTPLDSMDRMALLKALAKDDGFHNDLKDVALGQCKVMLLRRVAGKKPTAAEEVDTVALEEADTIGEALQAVCGSGGPPTAGKVFIRVRLPGARVAADGEDATSPTPPLRSRPRALPYAR